MNAKPIRLIELFAGYGSQALALKYLGVDFEHYQVCEFDRFAMNTYNEIHGTNFETTDVSAISLKPIDHNYLNILTYSFPCTDLSVAGAMKGMSRDSGTRSSLLWQVERLLKECVGNGNNLPQVLVMENVKQVHSNSNIDSFNEWISFLDGLGYTSVYEDLNSVDFGVPQSRNRTFMVSILGDIKFKFPKGFELKTTTEDFLEETVEDRYTMSERLTLCFCSDGTGKYPRGRRFYENVKNGTKPIANTILTTEGTKPVCNFVSMFDSYESLDDVKNKAHFKPFRRYTPRECFRLMGVKDEDSNKITCSNTQKYKQAGNSIVVDVLMYIFNEVLKCI